MGEIRTWINKEEYIKVLKKEVSVLQTRFKPHEEGTGHFNTAASVLQHRIDEIRKEMELDQQFDRR